MLKILNYKHLFFTVMILLQMVAYNYPYLVKIEPRTIHAWRQFDCLSFAEGFYNGRSTFFEPHLNNLGSNDGRAVSDFPIIQFMVGNIWKFTGVQTIVYRVINIVFLFFGLFCIYKLFLDQFKNKIFAVLIAAFIFTSANLSYYGVSTISDVQSFSLSMAGFYFFYSWLRTKKKKHFLAYIILFSLAGLLKVSAAMVYILCLLNMIFEGVEKKQFTLKLLNVRNLLRCIILLLPFVFWVAWYSYANYYNTKNNSGFFLIGILPIWKMQYPEIYSIFSSFVYELLPQIIHPVILFSIFTFIVTNSFFNIKKYFSSSLILICCALFFILFILLFFDTMDVHDYYLINMTGVLVVALFFIFRISYDKIVPSSSRVLLFVLIFFVALNTWSSSLKTWIRINCNVANIENSILFNSTEQKSIFWTYWLDRAKFKVLEDKKFDLSKIGVLESDTIFCLGDETANRSLYLLNKVGYTSYNTSIKDLPLFLERTKAIKYLFLIDTSLRENKYLKDIFSNKIYEKDGLSIYRVARRTSDL